MKISSAIAIISIFAFSGCSTYSLEKLRHTEPKGSEFQKTLAKLYMNFADGEEKAYDWQDSWYFADKGLFAAYGKDIAPEELNNWNIPANERNALEIARNNLINVLTPEKIKNRPDAAARAQFNFDCWIEQQEENWQIEDIEACRDGFKKALAELAEARDQATKKYENPFKKPVLGTVKKTEEVFLEEPVKKKLAKKALTTTTSFVVFFEAKQTVLTTAGSNVLAEVARTIAASDDYEVVVIDKSGARKDDAKLSAERIASVKKWLAEAGAKESAIKTDGKTKNTTNRKIEIFLND